MVKRKARNFGQVVRDRRRELDLTQQELANQIETSSPYIGHLESSKRNPSDKVLARLAGALGLDRRELFLLANPRAAELLRPNEASDTKTAWQEFNKDDRIRRTHKIVQDEMQILLAIAQMGEVSSPRDFIYLLQLIRHVLNR
jgi:transcriptional regulator with XRE-family HTH domain